MRSIQERLVGTALCLGVALAFALSSAARAEPAEMSVLTGTVHVVGTNAPMSGVSVIAYHLSSEKTFVAAATDGTGRFRLPGLPQGYFDLAVRTPEGLFVGNQVVNVSSTEVTDVSVDLDPDATTASLSTRDRFFAGGNEPTAGEAVVRRTVAGRGSFWSRPGGISVIAGAGALTLLAIGGGSGAASPYAP